MWIGNSWKLTIKENLLEDHQDLVYHPNNWFFLHCDWMFFNIFCLFFYLSKFCYAKMFLVSIYLRSECSFSKCANISSLRMWQCPPDWTKNHPQTQSAIFSHSSYPSIIFSSSHSSPMLAMNLPQRSEFNRPNRSINKNKSLTVITCKKRGTNRSNRIIIMLIKS